MPHSIRPTATLNKKGIEPLQSAPADDGCRGPRMIFLASVEAKKADVVCLWRRCAPTARTSTQKGARPWDTHPSPPRTILRAAFIGRNIRPSVSSGGQRNPWFLYHSPSPLLGSTTTNFAPMESASSTDRSMASETTARPTPLPWQPTSTARRPIRIAGKDTLLIPDLTLFGTEKLSIDVIERQKRPTSLPSDTHAYTLHISLTCHRSA